MSRTNIEDIYPLAPLQQGILFHTLYASEAGVYFVQIGWTLKGALDVAAFLRAWQEVMDRHAILRTAFVWERFEQPMQVVWKRVKLPVEELDLRGLGPAEQADRVARFAAEDRRKGFNLTRAPLMRVALLRLADDAVRFLWSSHHLLLDGWSTQIVLKEVFGLYEAFTRGEAPRLERPRPYGEYIGWLKKQDASKIQAFWREHLRGFAAPTRFGVDRASPAAGEGELDERAIALPVELSAELAAFARQNQLTMNTLLQGAWALLLARYSGDDDVLFGATVSGRSAPVPGIERTVGLFINTLPVRVFVRPDDRVLAWLERLQAQQVELRELEHSPLVEVQGWSDVPRGTPLFESLVVFENYPVEASLRRGPGALSLTDARADERPNYPLSLIGIFRQKLHLTLGFERRRFTGEAIERMLGHLRVLLEGMLAAPAGRLADLPILGEDERRTLLVAWNDTSAPYPESACLHQLFEAQVDRTPDALAAVCDRDRLTYRELDRRANQLAGHLRGLGVGPEVLVGLCVERSLDLLVAMLGILKAGGAYVSMDPAYPRERLAVTLEDARAAVLVTERGALGALPPFGGAVVQIDADWPAIAERPDTRPDSGVNAGNLAYTLFTSGSTGRPKGVAIEHHSPVALVSWARSVYGPDDLAGVLFSTSVCFDLSVFEVFVPLAAGGAVIVARNALELPALAARGEVTLINTVPSAMAELLRLDAVPASVRTVNLAGEPLPHPLARQIYAVPTIARLLNLYGPTEDTTYSTFAEGRSETGLAPPIGRPIANGTAYVLDRQRRPTPIGVPGELYLGGAGLARGYLHRPELTAERFVQSPFVPGERLYKTGDLVRYGDDGVLEYLGRIDDQVKVRGFRIELGEIEAVLLRHPAVREAAVLAREDAGDGGKRLVAYLAAGEAAPSAADLRAHLREHLPEFMVPSAYVVLERLPQTANGKIDRRALPAPEAGALVEADYVAPRGPIEEALAAIFAEVLRVPEVGAHHGFFDLGGHSVLATQAVARVRDALGVDLPLRTLFEAPTPAELAARVREAMSAAGASDAAPPIERAPRDRALRLSFAQERLYFLDQLDPGNPAYNVPATVRLSGAIDAAALEAALREVVRRHEVLRTTFATSGSGVVQIIQPDAGVRLAVDDLGALPPAERERALHHEAALEAEARFDLSRGPLLRARLFRLGVDDHVLVLTMHHIVADAWTIGIINREISALYAAFSAGRPSPLPELAIQYADYAEWQRRWLSGEALDRQLAYWRQKLAGAPPALDLPTDRPRPPAQTFRGSMRGITLSPEATRALHDLSRREGVTLYMTLLAGLDLLLERYTGQRDVVVGTSIANRTRSETDKLAGFFVNALVLRTEIDLDETVRQLLARVKEVCLGAYAHQDMPFDRLVQELAPAPDPSRTPLFQIIFTMVNAPREALSLAGLELSGQGGSVTSVKYDLTLFASEGPRGLTLAFAYNVDLFDAATIDRMLGHLRALLDGMAKDPQKKAGDLPALPEEERRRLLVEHNETAVDFPRDECVHDLFEARADAAPDALALVAGDARLTYREVEARANRLANRLRRLGVGPDTTVALCLGRSAGVVIGMLGILKAGGAYVPLDPAHPPARLAELAREAGAGVLVTESRFAALFERRSIGGLHAPPQLSAGLAVVRLDDAAELAGESDARPDGGALPQSLAYVLFTSGSTGKPKGALVEHGNLVNYVRGVATRLALPPDASYAHVSTFSADLGNTVLFPPLCLGGTLHVIDEELSADPDAIARYFQANAIDCLKIVPSHLSALLSASRPEQVLPRRLLVLGGEAPSWELVDRIQKLAPGLRVLNHYGPTETTVGVLTHAVEKGARPPEAPIVPLGRPLPNTRIYVLDARMRPTPAGVPGEIYVGGAQVARGYLGRPDLTAERFVRDPFPGAGPAARLYKTGDRARWLPDGTLLFLGRADLQVKIRGFRVELGEIEAALAASPGVQEAVVLAQGSEPRASASGPPEGGGDKRLIAFVVPAEATGLDVAELRASLAARLPEPMIPARFVVVGALPLTPNGKIDRRALAALERQPAAAPEGDGAPSSPVEEVLAAIWCDVFGLERVGVHERFADLGGHSLLAIQIVARAREAFQAELPLRLVFEAPTIAELAAKVEAAIREGHGLETPPVRRMPRGAELRLSFAQERLWFLDQLEPGSAFYNISSGIRFGGDLDAAVLERALREVMRRHEVLRTTFATADGQPVQVIREEVDLRLAIDDLAGFAEAEREAAVRAAAAEEAGRAFDLGAGPLLRARLLRVAVDDHVLLLTMHHIVSDAWTRGVLSREITQLYQAFRAGKPSPLPELAVQYADYAYWQRNVLQGDALLRHLAYWKGQLDGAPAALDLPADRPRPPIASHRGAKLRFQIAPEPARALRALARREGVTLFMLLLAAFDVLLHRVTGQDDVVIGTPVANRSRPEIEPLAGFFVNTLVLRAALGGDPTFPELLARVREACLGAYAHQDMPFERLVQELAPERDLGRTPLFQVMFTIENAPPEAIALPGLRRRPVALEGTTAKFDLTLAVMDTRAGFFCLFEYATDLFDEARIARLAGHFEALLAGIAEDASRPIGELPILSAAERERMLHAWNDTEVAHPTGALLHEIFAAQAARTPDAIAVSFEGQELTFQALDERANQLAHALRKRGVGPDVLVGVCMDRSLELVISVHGVLKAGGAYVPLDPEYPKDRLAFMLQDARPPVILAQARLAGVLPAHGAEVIHVDAGWAEIAAEPAERPGRAGLGLDHLAYVIYTSGSTGRPKGAMNAHRGVLNRLLWMQSRYALDAGDRVLQKTPFSFDVSVWELFWPLMFGARLVLAKPGGHREPAYLAALIEAAGITTLHFVPSMLGVFLDELAANRAARCASIRRVFCSGEALVPALVEAFFARVPGAELHNLYGPTEAAVDVTAWACERGAAVVPIGKPIDNVRVYLLDARMQPVPIGVRGELYIGGVQVARGYLNRAELTAERFVADPFAAPSSSRLYRTGDVARYLESGDIEYLGRVDHQVKIRGFRVELGEIEAQLARHPEVRACAVVLREDLPGDKRIVAYVESAGAATLPTGSQAAARSASTDLRAFLGEKLPEFMIPSAFVALDALPLTASGKIDRRALPAPDPAAGAGRGRVEPRSAVEESLAGIYAEVLALPTERVGVHDSFFDLGGHSLLAVRLFAQIERVFGRKLPLATLFTAPSVADLAAVLAEEQGAVPRSLIEMNPLHGDTPPLFWCGFNFAELTRLSKQLPDQPLFHLQSGYFDVQDPATHIRDLAARYVHDIRIVQPEGPYYLGGSCLDGFVAFEIALQLEAQGQRVALLVLVERDGPDATYRRYQAARSMAHRVRHHEHNLERLDGTERAEYARSLWQRFRKRVTARFMGRDAYEQTVLAHGREDFVHLARSALRSYTPQGAYSGRTVMIFSSATIGDLPTFLFPQCGWGKVITGSTKLHVVPGDHESVASDRHVKALADRLRVSIAEARAEHPAPPAAPRPRPSVAPPARR